MAESISRTLQYPQATLNHYAQPLVMAKSHWLYKWFVLVHIMQSLLLNIATLKARWPDCHSILRHPLGWSNKWWRPSNKSVNTFDLIWSNLPRWLVATGAPCGYLMVSGAHYVCKRQTFFFHVHMFVRCCLTWLANAGKVTIRYCDVLPSVY